MVASGLQSGEISRSAAQINPMRKILETKGCSVGTKTRLVDPGKLASEGCQPREFWPTDSASPMEP